MGWLSLVWHGHPALPDRGHSVWQNVAIPFFNFLVLAMFIFIGISIIKHTTSRVCGKTTDNHRRPVESEYGALAGLRWGF